MARPCLPLVEHAAAAAAREKESIAAEAEARKAKAELEQSLAELKAQEDAYNNKTAELKRKSEEGSVVQQNKAKAELAQHLAEDPLPLRRAKINNEASVRKADKTAKAAAAAVEAAVAAAVGTGVGTGVAWPKAVAGTRSKAATERPVRTTADPKNRGADPRWWG